MGYTREERGEGGETDQKFTFGMKTRMINCSLHLTHTTWGKSTITQNFVLANNGESGIKFARYHGCFFMKFREACLSFARPRQWGYYISQSIGSKLVCYQRFQGEVDIYWSSTSFLVRRYLVLVCDGGNYKLILSDLEIEV